jgi:F-type H+-transporting ATPase subunit c
MYNTMRTMKFVFMSLAAMLLATPAFAQATGRATASSAEALARNPGARPGIFLFLIMGLAFIESLALFTFVIIFLKVK